MEPSNPPLLKARPRWRRYVAWVAVALAGVFLLGSGWSALKNYWYPYGWSHCCDKQLAIALLDYADTHDGKFPTGGDTPEASLGLLYPVLANANVLRGKIVPEEVVEQRLATGQPLTPETCGWHYEDGLSLPQNFTSSVAIVWDKVGLGHHGQRLHYGGHSVVFMDGGTREIREADWSRFLAEQEKAWDAIRRGVPLTKAPWVPME